MKNLPFKKYELHHIKCPILNIVNIHIIFIALFIIIDYYNIILINFYFIKLSICYLFIKFS